MAKFQQPQTVVKTRSFTSRLVLHGAEVGVLVDHFQKISAMGDSLPPALRNLVTSVLAETEGVEDFVNEVPTQTIQEAAEQAAGVPIDPATGEDLGLVDTDDIPF